MLKPLTNQLAICQLVVVDMQTKLAPAMVQSSMQLVQKNITHLLQAAQLLSVQTIFTEQYPQGLGNTLPDLQNHALNAKIISKTTFSACAEPTFKKQLTVDKPQIILTGMEAHICVLQTALNLINMNKHVFIIEDAIISRDPANKSNALARLRDAGCIITNTESVIFEWLGNAKHTNFKQIAALIK